MAKTHKKRKIFSSFAFLNLTQFCSALNDNVYKLLLVFSLISLKGIDHSNTILSLAGAIFVIPFLLFASTAGTLADRFSKRSIIYVTRMTEIVVVTLGVISFMLKSAVMGYAVLFLMAAQSTLFSPAKYGIIPEIVKKEKITHYNGLLTATTYLAIILGTFFASFLADISNRNFVLSSCVCIVIAILGAIFSMGIEKTVAQSAGKKMSTRFITDIYRTLKRAKKIRYLLPVILFAAYFLFLGAYTQLNIIPFAVQSLHLSEIEGGYLFLMTAIGIGVGAFVAGSFAKEEVELGIVPLASLGIAILLTVLYFFQHHFIVVPIILVLLGMLGGFYIVPIEAYIQIASPKGDRGESVAAANFSSFVGVVIASFLIALLGNGFGFTAAEGFLTVGCFTYGIAIFLFILMGGQTLRFLVAVSARTWNIHVVGRKNLRFSPPVLLVGERTSWIDTIIVMATLPRLIRYIVPVERKALRKRKFAYKTLRMTPIPLDLFSPLGDEIFSEIKREIKLGHSVCLMLPVSDYSKTLKEWEITLHELFQNSEIPIVPIHIQRKKLKDTRFFSQLKFLFTTPLKISYGNSDI